MGSKSPSNLGSSKSPNRNCPHHSTNRLSHAYRLLHLLTSFHSHFCNRSKCVCPPSLTVLAACHLLLYQATPSLEYLRHRSGSRAVLYHCWPTSLVSMYIFSLPLDYQQFRLNHMKLPFFFLRSNWLNIGNFIGLNLKTFLKVLNTVLPVPSRCLRNIC